MKKNKNEIIYYLANKYNLPLKTINKMVLYQFKYVSKIMKEGNFEAVRLPYFGRLSVNPNRVKYINKIKKK